MRNTCYFNSALQVLYNTKTLVNMLQFFAKDLEQSEFIKTYLNVLKAQSGTTVLNFNDLKNFYSIFLQKCPFFENLHIQHDSCETMLCVIDTLYEEFKCTNFKSNYIEDIFDFKLKCDLKCNNCGHVIVNDYNQRNISIESNSVSVQESLNNYFNDECMEDYKCEKCKEKQCCKSYKICKIPHVLIVNINSYDIYGEKVALKTNIEDTLKFHDKNFELRSALCHHGSSHNGHYTSSVKIKDNYYIIDDDIVHILDEEKKKQFFLKNAYLLMYHCI